VKEEPTQWMDKHVRKLAPQNQAGFRCQEISYSSHPVRQAQGRLRGAVPLPVEGDFACSDLISGIDAQSEANLDKCDLEADSPRAAILRAMSPLFCIDRRSASLRMTSLLGNSQSCNPDGWICRRHEISKESTLSGSNGICPDKGEEKEDRRKVPQGIADTA
jgi:hypothetical protein